MFGAKRNLKRHIEIKHKKDKPNRSTNSNISDSTSDKNGNASMETEDPLNDV